MPLLRSGFLLFDEHLLELKLFFAPSSSCFLPQAQAVFCPKLKLFFYQAQAVFLPYAQAMLGFR